MWPDWNASLVQFRIEVADVSAMVHHSVAQKRRANGDADENFVPAPGPPLNHVAALDVGMPDSLKDAIEAIPSSCWNHFGVTLDM